MVFYLSKLNIQIKTHVFKIAKIPVSQPLRARSYTFNDPFILSSNLRSWTVKKSWEDNATSSETSNSLVSRISIAFINFCVYVNNYE